MQNIDKEEGNVLSKASLPGGLYNGSPVITVMPYHGNVGEKATVTVDFRGMMRAEKLLQVPSGETRVVVFEYSEGLTGPPTMPLSPVVVTEATRLLPGEWKLGVSVVDESTVRQK